VEATVSNEFAQYLRPPAQQDDGEAEQEEQEEQDHDIVPPQQQESGVGGVYSDYGKEKVEEEVVEEAHEQQRPSTEELDPVRRELVFQVPVSAVQLIAAADAPHDE